MRCSRNPVRLSKYLVHTVSALFILATIWPIEEMSNTYGVELQPADTVKAVFNGPVAEAQISGMVIDEKVAKMEDNQSDSLQSVAKAHKSGIVIAAEAPGKKKGSNSVITKAVAAGLVVGAALVTYLLLSGKDKQGGRVPADTTGPR